MSDNNNSNNNKPLAPGPKPKFNIWWVAIACIALALGYSIFSASANSPKEISIQDFYAYLQDGDVKEVVIVGNKRKARVYLTEDAKKETSTKQPKKAML
jgi:hypothetical protein